MYWQHRAQAEAGPADGQQPRAERQHLPAGINTSE
eukprot:SAG31_NODE_28662_length_406_cov_15.228013_1_plen_34_part_10